MRCRPFACGTTLTLALLAGCTSDGGDLATVGPIDTLASPAANGSGEPNLATAPDGRVYLSWLERQGDSGHALRFATLEPEHRWSVPRTIARRPDFFVNWADFPSLVPLSNRALAAHWLQRSGSAKYAYDVRIAQSTDGGETWSEARVPHRDGTATEHGFVSLFPFRDSLGAIWLDGRNFAGVAEGAGANMMLVTTTLAPAGSAGPERVIDERVCDCCQTSTGLAASGPVVVYRDRLDGEIRDISVVRWSDTGWTRPTAVHADNWHIDACPVNGPAIDADGERIAVAWFTSARDTARVYVAFSNDAGVSFGAPTRIDDGNPVGRVDVELDAQEGAIVSWMEFTSAQEADVRVRRVAPGGARSAATVVARTSGARASGFPRMVTSGNDLIFAWTEAGTPSRIRVARARLARNR
jgi:hypothetical protein